ncbi:Riboflavin biosynthesis protein RibBA [Trichinella spiralis]|uniref:Riboflavin biosynthesis protein RibBA n=1 Tax=Trichinella spiralis TaxID=6334 RepID=A0ABR3KEV3_TRISP
MIRCTPMMIEVQIKTDQTIKDISRNISDKTQLKELEIKVILPTDFRYEGITQRFIKWLLGDRAVEGLKYSSATVLRLCTP